MFKSLILGFKDLVILNKLLKFSGVKFPHLRKRSDNGYIILDLPLTYVVRIKYHSLYVGLVGHKGFSRD